MAILPTLRGQFRDTRVKAATDMTIARVSMARSLAIEQARNYTLESSPDGRQLRVTYDENDSTALADSEGSPKPQRFKDPLPDEVVLSKVSNNNDTVATSTDGWTRLATFLPDGTCLETTVQIKLTEPNMPSRVVEIRGLTGSAALLPIDRQQVSP